MKTIVALCLVFLGCGMGVPLQAEPATGKPGHALGMPYPDREYVHDRRGTGPYFRAIRKARQERGIEAGIAMLGPSLEDFRENLRYNWTGSQVFDGWGFWVWHEAQFDSGKNDPEWAAALYRWIFDEARRIGRMDWVFHVSGNVLGEYATVSRWTPYRQLLAEMSGYLKRQGLDVDPSRLPDRGLWDEEVPGVRLREFPVKIPNGRHVVYWQRHEQKDASKPTWMDNISAHHLMQVGDEHFRQGEWRKSIELGLWVCASVDAISEFNRGKTGRERVKREEMNLYLGAVQGIVGTLRVLGLREAEERLVARALEKKLEVQWGGTMHNHLRSRLLDLRIQRGEAAEAMLDELDRLIADKDHGHHQSELGAVGIRLVKGRCLMALGRKDEALVLLEELRRLTGRKYGSWLAVELTHVDWCLDLGDLKQPAVLLPELLQRVREDGLKVHEIALYERYVRLAELSGDLGLAVYCQRELLRLLEVFAMTPCLPEERAKLARLLALAGEKDEAAAQMAKALALAETPNLPRRVLQSVRNAAADLAGSKGVETRKGRVLLQPGTAVSMAAAGFPARLVLEVVNVGEGRASGTLRISGVDCELSWDRESRRGKLDCRAGGDGRELTLDVDAQSMSVFHCVADAVPEDGLVVKAEWLEGGEVLETAEWSVQAADANTSSAVIDAGIYRTDGFCMIPVYHHLQSRDRGLANLRVLSSAPCRVELYDEAGHLRMVDATGNGSCLDRGDWLRDDADGNGAVELAPAAATGETNFHLFVDPEGAIPAEGVVLRIEWLIDGKWCLAAEDRIMGK
jgi:tetratricopeptide (TPR) repeat protein